jgi:hypothetical protein
MTIDYNSLITVDQKRNILQQRITQFAAEAYQHSLNRQTCVSIDNQEGIEEADKAISVLSAAIEVHQNELNSLPESPVE